MLEFKMENLTNYEIYLQEQLQSPEFAAHFTLAMEKTTMEMMLASLKQYINDNQDRSVILRDIRRLECHLAGISFV
jgi:hypothetical protein